MSDYEIDKSQDPETHGREHQVFAEYLQRKGLKFTSTRRQLLERIFEMHDHFTAEQLLERFRESQTRVSKATVYRTLGVMLDCGLLESHDFGEGSLFYEHTFGHRHHDHIFCLNCKTIVEFVHEEVEALQAKIAEDLGFVLLAHSHKLFGLCESCRSDPEIVSRTERDRVGLAPPHEGE